MPNNPSESDTSASAVTSPVQESQSEHQTQIFIIIILQIIGYVAHLKMV